MIEFDPARRRLDVSADELGRLVRHVVERGCDPLPSEWASLIHNGEVHPVAAAIAAVAAAPDRAIAIERLTDDVVDPLMVGWHRSGRATLTEHHGAVPAAPNDGGDGYLSITATHLELLPALVLQLIGLQPDQPPARRDSIETTAGIIDDTVVDLARGGIAGSLAASDDLLAVVRSCERIVRATGSWRGAASDSSVTLLLAGVEGVWHVERDEAADGVAKRDGVVRLDPIDVATATARLGDVVTGRAAPGPEPAAAAA